MSDKIVVWITTSFIGYHRWTNAPGDVAFLRSWHRHVFHVRLAVPVSHGDRDVEFIKLKREVDSYLRARYEEQMFELSCEMIAAELLRDFRAFEVSVSEDGENGATVTRHSQPDPRQVQIRCFVGAEAEGPFRGDLVLFVPGSVGPSRFLNAFEKVRGLQRIYYGAGNDRDFRPDTLSMIIHVAIEQQLPVTLEIDGRTCRSLHGLPEPDRVMSCVVTNSGSIDRWPGCYIKAVSGQSVKWEKDGQVWETKLNDSLFSTDTFVE